MHQKIKNKKQKNRKNKMTYVPHERGREGEMPITSITMGDQEMGKYNTHNNKRIMIKIIKEIGNLFVHKTLSNMQWIFWTKK